MDLYDQHLHSRHSFDSRTDPIDNVRCAIANGLRGLTFTEHFDTHPDEWVDCVYDEVAYGETILGLRREFGESIFIGKGIEVCYQPERMNFVLDFLARHQFDLVILSVHFFGDQPVHDRKCWDGVLPEEGTRRYLETVRQATEFVADLHRSSGPVFNVLGHLDFVKRYTRRWFGVSEVDRFGELIDEILKGCLAANMVPEINTSTLRQDAAESMPGLEIIRRYVVLGGVAMTIGSDAHRAEDVGAGFDEGLKILQSCGVEQLALFENRQARNVPVEPAR